MSEVQHGRRLGFKDSDIFWSTGVIDSMALSLAGLTLRKFYCKTLWRVLKSTGSPVHWGMEFIDLMLAVLGAVSAGFGVVLMIHEWRSLDSFRRHLRSSNNRIS
jgi:hypothetical protein